MSELERLLGPTGPDIGCDACFERLDGERAAPEGVVGSGHRRELPVTQSDERCASAHRSSSFYFSVS